MPRSIISEGKTTQEAIDNGLKQLKLNKSQVEIKVLEEEKRSFFSILTPRVVKVEIVEKENKEEKIEERTEIRKAKREYIVSKEDLKKAGEKINEFLEVFLKNLPTKNGKFSLEEKEDHILVTIKGENLNYLIGYRGETLNSLQVILTSVANNELKTHVRVILDIGNYREKREKALEDLAEKIAKTVVRTRKSVTLEPMTPYERKIIHSKLQNNNNVKTFSTGVEPQRRVVIALK